MDYISLLLLDAGRILGPAIKEILESSAFHPIVYLKESVRELKSNNFKDYLGKIFSVLRCDTAILVLPPEFHEVSSKLRIWIQRLSETQLPLLAVIEDPDQRGGFTLIARSGGQIVETGSPSASRILSYVWHTTRYLPSTENQRCFPHLHLAEERLIGSSPVFLDEVKKLPFAANSSSNVFISGAIGTGKRHFARTIHFSDKTSKKPFSVFCCGFLSKWSPEESDSYFEFPSAESIAHKIEGGTLYLDEIDCLSDLAQVKLLHFLKNKNYLSFGPEKVGPADFRVIAGCNADPDHILKSGQLRKDLYNLLNIVSFKLPLLKNRKEDIALLAEHFLKKFSNSVGKQYGFTPEAMAKLVSYDWPGNIRELEYTIFRAISQLERKTIQESDIKLPVRAKSAIPFERPQKTKKGYKIPQTKAKVHR